MASLFAWFKTDKEKEAKSCCAVAKSEAVKGDFVEPNTGLTFKGEFCSRANQRVCPSFAGRGARLKNIAGIKVKVYAAGIFVDEKVARSKVKANSHVTPTKTIASSNDIEKTIQLIFARGVKGPTVLAALDERLKPTLEGTAELTAFRELFKDVLLEKGQELSFTADRGVLTTKKNNKTIGAINSAPLCCALFDIYLGDDPVIKELKNEVAINMSKMLMN